MAGEVLLEIGLGVELEHLAHVVDRHAGHVGVADQRIVDAHGQGDDTWSWAASAWVTAFRCSVEHFGGERLFVNGRVQQGIAAQGKALAAALHADGLGGAPAQIHRQDLVSLPAVSTVKKWKGHARLLYSLPTRYLPRRVIHSFGCGPARQAVRFRSLAGAPKHVTASGTE